MKIPALFLTIGVSAMFCEYAITQDPPPGPPSQPPTDARQKPAPRVLSPLEQQEIDARERQILRQKLLQLDEHRRKDWGEVPLVRGQSAPGDVELARKKVEELEGRIKLDSVIVKAPANSEPVDSGTNVRIAASDQPVPTPAGAPQSGAVTPPRTTEPQPGAQNASPEDLDRAASLLRQRIAELENGPVPVPAAPVAVAQAPEENKAVSTPIPPADPAAMDRAVMLLRQKVAEMEANPRPAGAPPSVEAYSVASQPAQAAQPALPVTVDSEAMERAVQALHEKIAEMEKEPPTPASPPSVSVFTQQPYSGSRGNSRSATPPPASATIVPTPTGKDTGYPMRSMKTRQQQLADLLQLYKDDTITPRQYQERRAKILADE